MTCNENDCLQVCSEKESGLLNAHLVDVQVELAYLKAAHEKQNELLEQVLEALKDVAKNPMALMPALMGIMKGNKS